MRHVSACKIDHNTVYNTSIRKIISAKRKCKSFLQIKEKNGKSIISMLPLSGKYRPDI